MEFLSDGTGIVYEKASKEAGMAITWKTEKDRFYITASGMSSGCGYKLQSSQLIFTDDKGEISVFAKCKKDCKETTKEYAKAARDNKKYKSVKIGNQVWMSENLNYAAEGSKCYGESGKVLVGYNEKDEEIYTTLSAEEVQANCDKYGRLYDWKTAIEACPKGWHLPSDDEWQTLVDFAGGDKVAGGKFKAKSGWLDFQGKSSNGTDDYGFSALPGGSGGFLGVGIYGIWWSATESSASYAWIRYMGGLIARVDRDNGGKSVLYSVRCVQN
jgi:uncharacterized protein (TIGR02145 family)